MVFFLLLTQLYLSWKTDEIAKTGNKLDLYHTLCKWFPIQIYKYIAHIILLNISINFFLNFNFIYHKGFSCTQNYHYITMKYNSWEFVRWTSNFYCNIVIFHFTGNTETVECTFMRICNRHFCKNNTIDRRFFFFYNSVCLRGKKWKIDLPLSI